MVERKGQMEYDRKDECLTAGRGMSMGKEDSIGYRMRLIHNCIHNHMEAKRHANKDDVTGMQRWILIYLKKQGEKEIYQKDIEQEFRVSRATASNMLQLMERKGLITRKTASCDARQKKLMLTPEARKLLDRAEQDIYEMEARIQDGFSEEEKKKLLEYLDRIMKNIGVTEE